MARDSEANQNCTILRYKKSMFGFEMTKFSKYKVIPGHKSWQIETGVWKMADFLLFKSFLLC